MIEANGKPIILLPLEQPLGTVESVLACPPHHLLLNRGFSASVRFFARQRPLGFKRRSCEAAKQSPLTRHH
jgi:hypothetical protein